MEPELEKKRLNDTKGAGGPVNSIIPNNRPTRGSNAG